MANIKYSDEQIEFLSSNINNYSLSELTNLFNVTFKTFRSENGIKNTLTRYKIKRPKSPEICKNELKSFFSANLNCTMDELTRRYNKQFGCNLCSASVRTRRRKFIDNDASEEEPSLSFTECNDNIVPHVHEIASTTWGSLLSKPYTSQKVA